MWVTTQAAEAAAREAARLAREAEKQAAEESAATRAADVQAAAEAAKAADDQAAAVPHARAHRAPRTALAHALRTAHCPPPAAPCLVSIAHCALAQEGAAAVATPRLVTATAKAKVSGRVALRLRSRLVLHTHY